MAGTDGNAASALATPLERLQQEPYRFDFYQAMRLLECAFPDAPRVGKSLRLSDEHVRLSQDASLRFSPASLAKFGPAEKQGVYKLVVYFLGLLGPNGALPLHLSEYAADRIRHHDDTTLAAFLDVFHHRMLSLFYRAWADAQPTVHYDRSDSDRYSAYVGSLIGIGMDSLRQRDELPDLGKLYYAGRFSGQTRHPEGLQSMIGDFFGLPVELEEFVGGWTELPKEYRFQLGEDPDRSTLGVACTIGSHVWDCQHRFRIRLGPMDWESFVRLLPGTENLTRLKSLVRNYIGDELFWDVNLVLKREDTPSMQLGHHRLGQTAWMDHAGTNCDAPDLLIEI